MSSEHKNVFIINAHQAWPFSEGKLNGSLIEQAKKHLQENGYAIRETVMSDDWDIDEEIAKHQWANYILLQSPVNWMGVPWLMKKYMDLIYTTGMDGRLCDGDGRTRQDSSKQYGSGGTLDKTKYLISLTFNAPAEAFNDPTQQLFAGKSFDDLFMPMHANFGFFGMKALPSFACFDVLKNPQIEEDFKRWAKHLMIHFPK